MADERSFYNESQATKRVILNCPYCRTSAEYDTRWIVRQKKAQPPGRADERTRAMFAKWQSYMVLADDKVSCSNMRCRKRFDISGIKTTAYL